MYFARSFILLFGGLNTLLITDGQSWLVPLLCLVFCLLTVSE